MRESHNRRPHRASATAVVVFLITGVLIGCAQTRGAALSGRDLAELRFRAELTRGLEFSEPVRAHVIHRQQVPAVFRSDLELSTDPGDLERSVETFAAIGFYPPGLDLKRALLGFEMHSVRGFYTPVTKRLHVVRETDRKGRSIGTAKEQVLVHELTHALQDEHFRVIDALLGLQGQMDLVFALTALLEGDALWTAHADADRMHGVMGARSKQVVTQVVDRLFAELSDEEPNPIPRAIREPALLEYALGYRLIADLEALGGTARRDQAFLDPPLSSAQLLHPERYLEPHPAQLFLELPREDVFAASSCEETGRNTLGELGIRIWLRERLGSEFAPISTKTPSAPESSWADGWRADRLAVAQCVDGTAFAWLVEFDDVEQAVAFSSVAKQATYALDSLAGLREPPRFERRKTQVLISAGIDRVAGERVLGESSRESHASLGTFLEAHPEVLHRAERLRSRAAQTVQRGSGARRAR